MLEPIMDTISSGIHYLLLWIDSAVYWFASQCYQLFIKLAGTRIFDDVFFSNLANRIYTVLGVFMLFYLAYALLTAIVDPEKLAKGDKGVSKIAINLVVSLVLLGLLPTIFNYAYRLQNYVLSSNLIGSLILGTPVLEVGDTSAEVEKNNDAMIKYGDVLSFTVLNTFLNPENINFNIGSDSNYTWYNFKADVLDNSNYTAMKSMHTAVAKKVPQLDSTGAEGKEVRISYIPVISTAAGIFLIYIMLSFTLDLGIRVIKFAFYQLIAPIPIIMRVIPGKKATFDKWLKQTLSVYFEVFVRVGFMYLAIYFINAIVNSVSLKQFWEGGIQGMLALSIIIMGILAFAKQGSKLISDLLGIDTGGLKLGIGEKLKAGGFIGKAINNGIGHTVGAVTGSVGAGISGVVNGAGATGFLFGAANGWKNKGLQFGKQRQEMYSKLTGDYKGKPGWFGGQSVGTRARNYMTGLPSATAKKTRDDEMEAFENQLIPEKRKEFNEKHDLLQNQYDQRLHDIQVQTGINDLKNKFVSDKNDFETRNQTNINSLTERMKNEETEFNDSKQLHLNNLQNDFMRAKYKNDISEMNRISTQMKEVEASHYDSSNLTQQIENLKQLRYESSEEGQKLLKQISDAQSVSDNDYILKSLEEELNTTFSEEAARSEIQKAYDKNLDQFDKKSREKRSELLNSRAAKKYHANVVTSNRLGEAKATSQQKEAFEKVLKDLGYKKDEKK